MEMTGAGRAPESASRIKYSFVVPVFNEEEVIPSVVGRITAVLERLDGPAEVIFVDDGSRDGSYERLVDAHRRDRRLKILRLSRNFGHQTAITAGLDAASGDAVIIIDADLQDPPEVVLEMIERWRQGYDVVYGVRISREGESFFKRITAHLFYRLLRAMIAIPIPVDAGDFRLVDRHALEAFRNLREHNRFVRGLFSWVGFRQTGVPYARSARGTGRTKYPLGKMVRLAFNGIIGFSDLPLRISIWTGVLISNAALLYGVYVIVLWLLGRRLVEGWTSTVVILTFLGGINLVMTGVVGLYVGRIHEEVKNRPLYIVNGTHGFDELPKAERAIFLGRSA